jgi:hypothetical protein
VPRLAPGARYRYKIVARDDVREGSFRTQAYWSHAAEASELTIAIGSCRYLANPNPLFRGSGGDYQIFDAIAAKRPELMLWLKRQPLSAAAGPRSIRRRWRRALARSAASHRCSNC